MRKSTVRDLIYLGLIILAIIGGAMAGLGCAGAQVLPCHERGPSAYTHEHPTQPFKVTVADSRGVDSWNSDGKPTVLTVHNPTDHLRQVHVVCEPSVSPTYIDYGHIEWWTCLKPHTEKRRLTEFMNRDAMTQVCTVAEQWTVRDPGQCIEDQDAQ